MKSNLECLIRKINYQFKDLSLLHEALSHRSTGICNNERMEFLGDSVINFVVADLLYKKFPQATEGELSRMRAHLVKGDTLAKLAKELSLGEFLRLGPGELKSGGYRRTSILANAFEAVIAAVYLDAGFERCVVLVTDLFASRLSPLEVEHSLKDAKTKLQEYLQAHKMPLPVYEVGRIEGEAHDQLFFVQCTVEGIHFAGEGQGTSRRRGEQEAAEKLLIYLLEHHSNE